MVRVTHLIEQARSKQPSRLVGVGATLWPMVLAVAVGLLMYLLVGPAIGQFQSKILLVIGINIILAVSLTVVNGFTGQFSMVMRRSWRSAATSRRAWCTTAR